MTQTGAPRVRASNSLQLRFMLLVMASSTVVAALIATLAYQFGQARALASGRHGVEALVTAVEKTLAIGVYAKDEVLLQEVAGGLVRNELVDVVEVVATDGQALARMLRPGAVERDGATRLTRALVSPFDAEERLGQLRISLNDAKVSADADHEAYLLAVAMAAQAVVLAFMLYLLGARMVSSPIVKLAAALRRMTPGSRERLDTPLAHAGDEIGMLIAGANELLEANERQLQTERRLRAEVEAMEAQYRQNFQSSGAGIFVLDAADRLVNGNPTVSRVLALPIDELQHLGDADFIGRAFARPEQVRQMIDAALTCGEIMSADLELVQRGEVQRWVHCLISVQDGERRTVEGVVYDITDRKRDESAVRYRAEHDALTQLKNRAAAHAALERLAAEAGARGTQLSLACLDLDGFKQINDSHGHACGDEVLVACAERMRAAVRRASDLVARMGGDEFLVVLRDVGPADAVLTQVMQQLIDGLTQPIRLSTGATVRVGASIGVACLPVHAAEPQALERAADEALYHVKRNGKLAFAFALADPPLESAR